MYVHSHTFKKLGSILYHPYVNVTSVAASKERLYFIEKGKKMSFTLSEKKILDITNDFLHWEPTGKCLSTSKTKPGFR